MEKTLRAKIYHFLVNRKPGIRQRYHRFHDGTAGVKKVVSWVYLLGLNFCYYVLFCRFLGEQTEIPVYEEKKPPCAESESVLANRDRKSVSETVSFLIQYEVISFDIFDTLIFRPMALPTDVFYMIGERLDLLDFKNVRVWAEWDARMKCKQRNGHMEVTLQDIWENLAEDTGLDAMEGMQLECEIEEKLCYANPYMLQVWKRLQELEKRVIIVSDMYLPRACIEKILQNAGYMGAERIYISSEYGLSLIHI